MWIGRWENAVSRKQLDSFQKGYSCSFSHDPASGRGDQKQSGQSSSPAPIAKAQTNGDDAIKRFRQQRREPFWNKRPNCVP